MMEEKATVIAVNGNEVLVQSTVKSTCSTCHQVDSCGSGQVAKAIPHKTLTTTLNCPEQVIAIGDDVILGIPENDILYTAWQVYLWPIIGLISFSGVGQWLVSHYFFKDEIFAILLGFFGGYLGFKLAQLRQKQRDKDDWLAPKLLSVLHKPIEVTHIQTK